MDRRGARDARGDAAQDGSTTDECERLDKGLDEAGHKGWTVVDMKADWKTVFAASK